MLDYDEAVQDLRFLHKRFNGLMALIPKLEQLGSLETAIQEADKRIINLRVSIKNLEKELETLEARKTKISSKD